MATEPSVLDQLPLDVLIALQEAMADPSEAGRVRAAQRAEDAGFYIQCTASPPQHPIPMDEAPEGVESLVLRFDR